MVIWLYILILIIALLTLSLLLRLRVQLILDDRRRLVFMGLGRSGSEIDFKSRRGTIRVAGIAVRGFSLDKKDEEDARKACRRIDRPRASVGERLRKGRARVWGEIKTYARIWWKDVRGRGDMIGRAVVLFGIELVRDVVLEQFEADIEAGFDEPHLTGQIFGYYQAAAAALPGVAGRIHFVPVWTGASFRGAVRLSVALPLYALVWRTLRLMWRLPITRLILAAIHKKKGDRDVKQRS